MLEALEVCWMFEESCANVIVRVFGVQLRLKVPVTS